ncbi:MAG: tetratricopeptide repeat protein [Bacteroidia bacterium]|nr:tetratricopeptide repeat protein [Bacteroidia bacterium]
MKKLFTYFLVLIGLFGFAQNPFITIHSFILQNNFNQARLVLDSCQTKNYFADSVYFYRGLSAIKEGKTEACREFCARLTKEFPQFYEVHYLKGLMFFQKQNFGKSADEFTRLLKYNPKDIKALFNRSVALGRMEDYLDAINDLNTCIEINSNYADAYYSRAYWYEYTGNYQEATKDYQTSIKLNPKNYDAYFGLAFIYQTLKESTKACETINKAILAGSQIAEEVKDSFCR